MKNISKIVILFVLGIGGGIFADLVLNSYRSAAPVYLTETKEIIVRENRALTNAVEKAEKIVVGVKTKTTSGEVLEGAGFIVASDGLLVTLASLVLRGSSFSFFVEGKPAAYQILKRDLGVDLALVKIEEANLPTVSFGDSEKLKLGERVFLVGREIVNEGVVRSLTGDLIGTNISEKNNLAGSPLFNIEGELLGINTIGSDGLIAAIAISRIKQFLGF